MTTADGYMFKPGDKVVCVRANDSWDILEEGRVYTVADRFAYQAGPRLDGVKLQEVYPIYWSADRFALAADPTEPPVKFKPGDRVVYVRANNDGGTLVKGNVYTVAATFTDGSVLIKGHSGIHWSADRFVPYTEEPPIVKFKPGDRVVCVNNKGTALLSLGHEYTVYLVRPGEVCLEETCLDLRWWDADRFAPDNGGPAFPEPGLSGLPNDNFICGRCGMSLRDWFAGQAMVGILAGRSSMWLSDDLAVMAYRFADAMLQARERE